MDTSGGNDGNYKAGFWVSLAGHCVCVVFIAASALFGSFFKKEKPEPVPFTLLPPPSEKTDVSKEKTVQTPKPSEIKVKEFERLDEIELPPEPPAELPEPANPAPKPEPKPEKPKPVAKDSNRAKPIPPKRVSAAEFFKNRKPQRQNKPKSSPRNSDYKITKVKSDLSSKIKPLSSSAYSGEVSSYESDAYQSEVYALLRRNWILPEECAGMDLVVGVRFTIGANGKVSGIRILDSSGESVFDKSVENVLKSLTFRSPPRGKPLTLAINFRAEEL